jgi:hypothetical protein
VDRAGQVRGQPLGDALVAAADPDALAGREGRAGVVEHVGGQLLDRLGGRDLQPRGDRLAGPRVQRQRGEDRRHRAAGESGGLKGSPPVGRGSGGLKGSPPVGRGSGGLEGSPPVGEQPLQPAELRAERGPVDADAAARLAVAVGHAGGDQLQAEPARGGRHRLLVALDELRTQLHHRAVAERPRVDPAADPLARLQHQRLDAAVGQRGRRGQAGEPGTDHADAHRRGAGGQPAWSSPASARTSAWP